MVLGSSLSSSILFQAILVVLVGWVVVVLLDAAMRAKPRKLRRPRDLGKWLRLGKSRFLPMPEGVVPSRETAQAMMAAFRQSERPDRSDDSAEEEPEDRSSRT